jgi:hypothetical protein
MRIRNEHALMNAADWIAVAGAFGAVAAAAIALFAIRDGRKVARKSEAGAKASLDETKEQVRISGQIAETADRTFALSCRPIIVSDARPDPPSGPVPDDVDERNRWTSNDFALGIQYPVQNIGVGPAMIVSIKMAIITGKDDGASITFKARSNIAAMAPSESGLMELSAIHAARMELVEALECGRKLTAEISYTDIGAKQRYLTRFVLTPRSHTPHKSYPGGPKKHFCDFSLDATQIYECDEQGNPKEPPIASSGQSALETFQASRASRVPERGENQGH